MRFCMVESAPCAVHVLSSWQAHDTSAWDLVSVATALNDWGQSLSDGVTAIADNISGAIVGKGHE